MVFNRKKKEKVSKEQPKEQTKPVEKAEEKQNESTVKFNPTQALVENIALLERGVDKKDEKLLSRVLRKNTPIRRQINMENLGRVVDLYYPSDAQYLGLVKEAMSKIASLESKKSSSMEVEEQKYELSKETRTSILPEVETYFMLIVVAKLLEHKSTDVALKLVIALLEICKHHNKRTLDLLQARGFHYFTRCYELSGKSKEIRPVLLAAHRTACLRFDEFGQATLINLILRNYLQYKLVDQATKFSSKANFPDHVSNNQQVRYLYYMGKIQAIQLDYSDSFNKLMQAIRKTPSHTAFGFRVSVYKLTTCVQLLLGETPERTWFSDPELKTPLLPYFELVKAVKNGNIAAFDHCCKQHQAVFIKDDTMSLVSRLRNSVIKTGLKQINMSYSKIAFKDVAQKLDLESAESAEFVCAKAIRDGVIDATIDHAKGVLQSSEMNDIYSTIEPQQAFHKRIQFCMGVHDDAVKAMRYPPGSHKSQQKQEEDDEEEKKTDEEIAKEIEAELEDDM